MLVAGLVDNHELHRLARPHEASAANAAIPGMVLAETWAALRRGPWNLSAGVVERALGPWAAPGRIVATPVDAYEQVLGTGRSLDLGGNVHDLLVALTCAAHDLPLTTLDRRQATLAKTLPGLPVTLLLPEE